MIDVFVIIWCILSHSNGHTFEIRMDSHLKFEWIEQYMNNIHVYRRIFAYKKLFKYTCTVAHIFLHTKKFCTILLHNKFCIPKKLQKYKKNCKSMVKCRVQVSRKEEEEVHGGDAGRATGCMPRHSTAERYTARCMSEVGAYRGKVGGERDEVHLQHPVVCGSRRWRRRWQLVKRIGNRSSRSHHRGEDGKQIQWIPLWMAARASGSYRRRRRWWLTKRMGTRFWRIQSPGRSYGMDSVDPSQTTTKESRSSHGAAQFALLP